MAWNPTLLASALYIAGQLSRGIEYWWRQTTVFYWTQVELRQGARPCAEGKLGRLIATAAAVTAAVTAAIRAGITRIVAAAIGVVGKGVKGEITAAKT